MLSRRLSLQESLFNGHLEFAVLCGKKKKKNKARHFNTVNQQANNFRKINLGNNIYLPLVKNCRDILLCRKGLEKKY